MVTDGDGNRVSVREVIKTTPGRKVAVLGDTHCSDHLLEIGRDCGEPVGGSGSRALLIRGVR